jgi:hypothetical protein
VTPAQLEDRLDRLERRLNPRADPARREAAIAELTRLVNGAISSLVAGHPPSNAVERAIVAHDGDLEQAFVELFEGRHAPRDR